MASAPPYGVFLAVLMAQGPWVSLRTPRLPPAEGPGQGAHGAGSGLRLLAVGDSIIAGVGVSDTNQALPSQFARALAKGLSRRVQWHATGVNGQRSLALQAMLGAAWEGSGSPDLVMVSNGINDVTRPGRPAVVLARLQAVLESVEQRFPDARILQLGLPPLGRFPGLSRPLQTVLGLRAAAIDEALGEWIHPRAQTVHLPFDEPANPEDFAKDGYHPNADGIRRWAAHLASAVRDRVFEPDKTAS